MDVVNAPNPYCTYWTFWTYLVYETFTVCTGFLAEDMEKIYYAQHNLAIIRHRQMTNKTNMKLKLKFSKEDQIQSKQGKVNMNCNH